MQKTKLDKFIAVFAAFLMVFYLPIEAFPGIKASAEDDVYYVSHGTNGLCLDAGKTYPSNTPATLSTLDAQVSGSKAGLLAAAMCGFNELSREFTGLDQQSLIWGIMGDDPAYNDVIAYINENMGAEKNQTSRVYVLVPQDSTYQRLISLSAPAKPEKQVTISFDKVGSDDPSGHLGGASFSLSGGGSSLEWQSSSSGPVEKSITAGVTYTLTETVAPSDYRRSTGSLTFTADENGNITCDSVPDGFSVGNGSISCVNQRLSAETLTIQKVDDDNKPLYGADFTISHGSETVSVSSADGSTKTARLYEGESYTITESSVPDGYYGAGSMSFTVENGSVVPTTENENYTVSGMVITCKNKVIPKVKVTIKKVDRSGQELSGAKLVLTERSYSSSYSKTIYSSSEEVELVVGNSYTLSEESAPTGYKQLSSSFTFTVEETSIESTYDVEGYVISGMTIIVTNEPLVTTGVAFRKVDGSGSAVSGAKFTLKASSSSYSKTVVSSSEEWNLEVGETYTLTEDEAPAGYKRVSGSFQFTVTSESSISVVTEVEGYSVSGMTITVVNVPIEKKIITIRKVGAGNDELSGAVLNISGADGFSKTITSTSNTAELYVGGTYTITETTAPTGYVLLKNSVRFTVTENGIEATEGSWGYVNGYTITIINNLAVSLTVKKIDDNGNGVYGAKFQISGGGESNTFTVSGSDGSQVTVEEGVEYTLTETEAPEGYERATGSLRFKIENGNVQVVDANDSFAASGSSITVTNQKLETSKIEFNKIDNNGDAVTGARFDLISGNTRTEVTLPISQDLYVGKTYGLVETYAPSGYDKLNGTFSFTVTARGVVPNNEVDGYSASGDAIIVTNQKLQMKSIKFNKVDDEGNSVNGAKFTLTDDKDWSTKQFTSSAGGNTLELIVGRRYRLTETSIPDGHDGVGSLYFDVTEDGVSGYAEGYSVSGDTITIVNKKLAYDTRIKARFNKVDESGKTISGAVFSLTDGETNETLYFDGSEVDKILVIGNTYTLTETTTPDGYENAGSFTFKVTTDGITALDANENYRINGNFITITDKTISPEPPAPSNKDVTFNKVDEDGNALSGVTFRLTGPTTEVLSFSGSPITMALVTSSEYTLTEVDTPDGYMSVDAFRFVVSEDGTITYSSLPTGYSVSASTVAITITNKRESQKEISFRKVDENGSDLSGAVFTLSTDGKSDVTINCTGSVVAKNLAVGRTYTLTETTAPTGYRKVKSFVFTVSETGIDYTSIPSGYGVDGSVITITNEPVPDNTTPVVFSKIDEDGKRLSGAVFTLTCDNDSDTLTFTGSDITEYLEIGKTYTVKETTVPEGYTGVSSSFTFTVTADGLDYNPAPEGYTVASNKITITNTKTSEPTPPPTPSNPTVKIIKMDATNNVPLASAKLQIVEGSANVKTWTSTTEAYSIKTLEVGKTYTLKEIVTPEGYTGVTSDFTFTVTADGLTYDSVPEGYAVDGFTITVKNTKDDTPEPEPEPGKPVVKVLKIDATNNIPLAGAKLQIVEGESSVKEWTSTTTAFTITSLEYDKTYTLKEIVVPTGYTGVTNDFTFTVTANGIVYDSIPDDFTVDGFTITVKNSKEPEIEPGKPVVKILKVDAEGQKHLAGATLQILENGSVIKEWTSTTDEYIFDDFEVGKTYVLREKSAPEGYTGVTDEFTFTITSDSILFDSTPDGYVLLADGAVYKSGVEDQTVSGFTIIVKNSKESEPEPGKPVVKILKVDAADSKPLAGAKLQIIENESVIKEWTSTTEAYVISDLKANTGYVLHEESAPEGYKKADDIMFTIDEDGKVYVSGQAVSNNTIVMNDEAKSVIPPTPVLPVPTITTYPQVSIIKVDADTNKPLANAHFQILDGTTVVKDWVSTTEKYDISDLEINKKYIIHEVSAPEGYLLAEDTHFTIYEDNIVATTAYTDDDGTLVIKDKKAVVRVSKVESSSKKELAGAQLAVYCNGQMIDSWTSDGFTEHVVTGLKANTTYSIRELSAPTGYSRMTADITFSIDNKGVIKANAPISNTGAILVENSTVPVAPTPTPNYYYPTPEPIPVLRYVIPDYLDYYTENVACGAGLEDDGEEIVG